MNRIICTYSITKSAEASATKFEIKPGDELYEKYKYLFIGVK